MRDHYIKQLLHSDIALDKGFDNQCDDPKVLKNLENLCVYILEPTLEHFGGELHITSGYRCQALNEHIGSNEDSQHRLGEAVDFGIIDTDIYEIACWIQENLNYDHLILENYNPKDLNKGWIHCSYTTRYPLSKKVQTYHQHEYFDGIIKL